MSFEVLYYIFLLLNIYVIEIINNMQDKIESKHIILLCVLVAISEEKSTQIIIFNSHPDSKATAARLPMDQEFCCRVYIFQL